jgi:hypothetical protein
MSPAPVVYSTPIFGIKIPSCLHPTITITGTTGTTNDIYEFLTFTGTFNGTNPTDWPASIDLGTEVRAAGEGFLAIKKTLYRPTA